jgi:hypothetical protein
MHLLILPLPESNVHFFLREFKDDIHECVEVLQMLYKTEFLVPRTRQQVHFLWIVCNRPDSQRYVVVTRFVICENVFNDQINSFIFCKRGKKKFWQFCWMYIFGDSLKFRVGRYIRFGMSQNVLNYVLFLCTLSSVHLLKHSTRADRKQYKHCHSPTGKV